jgi:hypothetical protein
LRSVQVKNEKQISSRALISKDTTSNFMKP